MNLHEHIRHILREETKINPLLRRRLHLIDDEVEMRLRTIYTPKNICRFESGEELLDVITEAVIDTVYSSTLKHIDDNSGVLGEIYYDMYKYIENKYGDKIMEYYNINCGK